MADFRDWIREHLPQPSACALFYCGYAAALVFSKFNSWVAIAGFVALPIIYFVVRTNTDRYSPGPVDYPSNEIEDIDLTW